MSRYQENPYIGPTKPAQAPFEDMGTAPSRFEPTEVSRTVRESEARRGPSSADLDTEAVSQERQIPSSERQWRQEMGRVKELADRIEEDLVIHLMQRGVEDVDGDATRLYRKREQMTLGSVVQELPLGAKGVNETRRCVIMSPERKEGIVAFIKPQLGELAMTHGPDGLRVLEKEVGPDGAVMAKNVAPRRKDKNVESYVESRIGMHDLNMVIIGKVYGISPDAVPIDGQEVGLRMADVGHAARAEVAASVLDRLSGLDVVPDTVFRTEGGQLASVQEGVPGGAAEDLDIYYAMSQGAAHPAAASLTRLACADYLLKSTDRHFGNIVYDREGQRWHGIDNGYSLGYSNVIRDPSVAGGRRLVPFDPMISVPLEIVQERQDMVLDDQARAGLRRTYDDIVAHMRYAEGQMTPEEASALSPAVKAGATAKVLSNAFRMLFERLDEHGNVVPETTIIAKQEALAYLRRMLVLAETGRPPTLGDREFSKYGLKEAVAAIKGL